MIPDVKGGRGSKYLECETRFRCSHRQVGDDAPREHAIQTEHKESGFAVFFQLPFLECTQGNMFFLDNIWKPSGLKIAEVPQSKMRKRLVFEEILGLCRTQTVLQYARDTIFGTGRT